MMPICQPPRPPSSTHPVSSGPSPNSARYDHKLFGFVPMPQKVHVPKFGNWDSENIPYTTFFENARKEKGAGFKIVNPNDPQENPDAFGPAYGRQQETNNCRRGYQKTLQPLNSGKDGTSNTETTNGKNNFDHTVPAYNQHPRSSNYSMDGSYCYSLSPPPSLSIKSASASEKTGHEKAQRRRVPSVPKLGDCNEVDPKLVEGFTFKFDIVKEKKIPTDSFPALPIEQPSYANKQKIGRFILSRSKILCCLFSDGDR